MEKDLENKAKNPEEDFKIYKKVLNNLLDVIEEEYKNETNFSKNGGRFTNAEKVFMARVGNMCENYKKTKDKEYLEITSNAMNKYNSIVDKYQ